MSDSGTFPSTGFDPPVLLQVAAESPDVLRSNEVQRLADDAGFINWPDMRRWLLCQELKDNTRVQARICQPDPYVTVVTALGKVQLRKFIHTNHNERFDRLMALMVEYHIRRTEKKAYKDRWEEFDEKVGRALVDYSEPSELAPIEGDR